MGMQRSDSPHLASFHGECPRTIRVKSAVWWADAEEGVLRRAKKKPNLSLKSKSETLKAKSNTQTLNRPQAGFMCLIYSEFSIQSCPKTFYGHFELELWETQ